MKMLKQFNRLADLIAKKFVKVYLDGAGNFYWIGNDRTGIIEINDHFIYLADMVFALENEVEADIFSEYQRCTAEGQYIPLRRYYINNKKIEALKRI